MTKFTQNLLLLAATLIAPRAFGAGFDTPVLYSARHMGMGGTAIGYVDDPSAAFHNPAGLSGVAKGAVLLNFSPILAKIHGSPSGHVMTDASGANIRPGQSIWSEQALSPAFLAGAGYRVHDKVSVGFAVYPVASAGGEYRYQANKGKEFVEIRDYTKLVFIDFAPSVSVEPIKGLRLGAAYRYATAQFDRIRSNPDTDTGTPSNVNLAMKGSNAKGFRLGAQYVTDKYSVGLVYRHKTETAVTAATGILENQQGKDITYGFVLPTKFGFGAQYKGIENLRLAVDVEYTLQSQNDTTQMAGTAVVGGVPLYAVSIPNIAKWSDNVTARVGAAYKIGDIEARLGYINDGQASQLKYVSPFGTPPTATHTATAGAGYKISDKLDINVAAAYRTGKATVTEADIKDNGCPFCGKSGEYEISLLGFYLDACYRFGSRPAPAPKATDDNAPKATDDKPF